MRKTILFSILMVLTTYCLVDRHLDDSFQSSNFFVSIPTQKQIETHERKITKTPTTRKPATLKFDKDFSDVEKLNFQPKPKKVIKFDPVAPAIKPIASVSSKALRREKTLSPKKPAKVIKTKNLKISEKRNFRKLKDEAYEISYQKISEQKLIKIRPLKIVSFQGVDLEKINATVIAATKISLPKTKKPIIDETENNEKTVDRISTVKAAPEKSSPEVKVINPAPELKNDMVYFDYSTRDAGIKEVEKAPPEDGSEAAQAMRKKPSVISQLGRLAQTAASASVTSTVKKPDVWKMVDTKKSKKKKLGKSNEEKVQESSIPEVAQAEGALPPLNEIKKALDKAPLLTGVNPYQNKSTCHKAQSDKSSYSFDYSIKMRSIGVTSHFQAIHRFEMRFQDDVDSIKQDFGTGKIKLMGDVKGGMNIRRATLLSRGHYPVTVDLALENTKADITIPALSIDKLQEYSKELGIPDTGAHLLVELDRETEDVDLGVDHNYKGKFFLDKNYNIVDRAEADYYFVFFMAVEPGNTILKFLDSKQRITTKIIHLSSEEIYYEPNFYYDSKSELISFYEQSPMSECLSMLSIPSEKVSPWALESSGKKENLNSLLFENVRYPLGSRKYYKLEHLDEPVFVGRWNQEEVVIPSEAYMSQVLSTFNIRGGECVVQINISDQPLDIRYNGVSDRRGINLSFMALDNDGKFYQDLSDQSKQLFLVGEEQGIINIELIYPDNTKRYLQTFCSENTYLIEQL